MASHSQRTAFGVRPLTETDVDALIESAGGKRAHGDANRRRQKSADYVLREAAIELKMLNEGGLSKQHRQGKLASLFVRGGKDRPVVVLDPQSLPEADQREYDHIVEGPIKNAVSKARKQLRQTRSEYPATTTSILFVINNGYTALNHDELLKLVAHRAKNDSSEIDGVVVAGCYFHSDGFDNRFDWRIEYQRVTSSGGFPSYCELRGAWNDFADKFMTAALRGKLDSSTEKHPIVDMDFEIDGVTFVKPAPPMLLPSTLYGHARPRRNSSGLSKCPPVALTFPEMTANERRRFHDALPHEELLESDHRWAEYRSDALSHGQPLQPFVPLTVTYEGWQQWLAENELSPGFDAVCDYVVAAFQARVEAILSCARADCLVRPSRYVLAVTEEIGQDKANDLTTISLVDEGPAFGRRTKVLAADLRIFHEHAIALAAAYAVARRIDVVLWEKDLRYAWT